MTTAKPKASEKPKRIRQMTSSEKAEAIALWRSGTVTLDDLAARFKKHRNSLLSLFEKEGVKKGEAAAETERKVKEEVEKTIVTDAMVLATRIRETKENHWRYIDGLSKLHWNMLVKAQRENTPLGSIIGDLKAVREAVVTTKLLREEKYTLLGITDDDNEDKPLPDLVVQELTASDIQELHRQAMVSDDEMGPALNDDIGDESIDATVEERIEINE